jgi:hypothetical protein
MDCASILANKETSARLCYNAPRFKVLPDLRQAVKRETGDMPVLPPQR